MINTSSLILIIGIILFSFSLINAFTTIEINPSFQRSEVLSILSSIIIITIALSLNQIKPKSQSKVVFEAKEGLFISDNLTDELKEELAWGSKSILTATAAATILIYWNEKTILKRGFISEDTFIPSSISANCIKQNKLISLPNTKNYPGTYEFDPILKNIPSLLLSPLGNKGLIIIGGWSPRCFTKSDEIWLKCWSERLNNIDQKKTS